MKMHNERTPFRPICANYRRTNRNWLDIRRTLMDNLSVDFISSNLITLISYFFLFSSLNFQKFITVLKEKKKFLSRPDLIKNYNIYF